MSKRIVIALGGNALGNNLPPSSWSCCQADR